MSTWLLDPYQMNNWGTIPPDYLDDDGELYVGPSYFYDEYPDFEEDDPFPLPEYGWPDDIYEPEVPVHEGEYHFERNRLFRGETAHRYYRKDNDSKRRRYRRGPGKKSRRLPWEAWRRRQRKGAEIDHWYWHPTDAHWWTNRLESILDTIQAPLDLAGCQELWAE